jgi:TPP-dependent pyruvate/acetoin dehydrogenase alpha subunit
MLAVHLLDAVFYCENNRMSVGFDQSGFGKATCQKLRNVILQGSELA